MHNKENSELSNTMGLNKILCTSIIKSQKFYFYLFIYLLFFFKSKNFKFRCGSDSKESTCNVGDLGPIPGLGRSPGEGNGYPLLYSGLENPISKKSDTTE